MFLNRGIEFFISTSPTLERWAEANEAAIRAARRLPQISRDKTLVVDHSEGGLVAYRISRDLPQIVTHVSSIAGGGGSQLYDLLALARNGEFFDERFSRPGRARPIRVG